MYDQQNNRLETKIIHPALMTKRKVKLQAVPQADQIAPLHLYYACALTGPQGFLEIECAEITLN